MARTFRTRRSMHAVAELNVTNLIDVAFTLLIIFMIATPLINSEERTIPLDLPTVSPSDQRPADPQTEFVFLSVDARGQYFIGEEAVTFTQLQTRLRTYAARSKQPVMRVRGDSKASYQYVIRLLDELQKQNLNRISFDTQVGGS
ncbi:biopolymer transport protein [Opitutaceae bacterium TAV1]|nr:biopolymer transportern ExbD [Opitutaceae bacterium TAV5]EIQ01923.1 biopolymer transport protein [Opitutaceae bacterium TAV1]